MRLMRGWGVKPDGRPGVLANLIASKFIDDNRYAEAYVREKTSLAGWGVYKIRRSLAAKGVSKEIIENTLSQLDRNSQKERLSTMLAKKMKGIKAAGDYEMKGKLMRYGMSQGYEYDDVISAVEEVMRSK